jgi:hypothetical protein
MRPVLIVAIFGIMLLLDTSRADTLSEEETELDLAEQELAELELAEAELELARQRPFCSCINPFAGTPDAYLGDPRGTCASTNTCYVPCNSDCRDLRPARGRGRCISSLACQPRLLRVAAPRPTRTG